MNERKELTNKEKADSFLSQKREWEYNLIIERKYYEKIMRMRRVSLKEIEMIQKKITAFDKAYWNIRIKEVE